MVGLTIENVRKVFANGAVGLDSLSLTADPGEMLVLLGPSGCGKSTLLRCLAGLERPTSGTIVLGEQTVFDDDGKIEVEPENRDVGMVFQNYALWPHMTVLQNVEFPLRARGMKQALRDRWAEETLDLVSCGVLKDRYPGQLSGGQQQRIGLARALVSRPALLLFDEPLSNLDARLRADLRTAIRELHGHLRFTGVYVTHDQEEGLSVADRIAVMNSGRLVAVGEPAEVHAAPPNDWAADFLGMTNDLAAHAKGSTFGFGKPDESDVLAELRARFRPHEARVASKAGASDDFEIERCTVRDRAFSGTHVEYVIETGGDVVRVVTAADDDRSTAGPAVGDEVVLQLRRDRVKFFTPDGTAHPTDQHVVAAEMV